MKTVTRISLLLLLTCSFSSPSLAGTDEKTVTLPASVYNKILERLDTLQAKVDALEQHRGKDEKTTARLEESVNDIYDTLDEVETKSIKDRINLGAELRARVDDITITDAMNPQTGQPEDSNISNRWTSRFRLNLGAEIAKDLSFNSRLTMYKDWSSTGNGMVADAASSHVQGDTSLKVDRAYIDWIVPNMPLPIALTIGRQPSTEGPASEFKENRLRQSTYPVLLFDGEADGIVATIGLEKLLNLKNSAFRFAYGKGYQADGDNGLNDLNVFGTFFETELPRLPDSLLVLSYVRGNDFIDNPFNPGTNLGDMDLVGVHVQAPHFLGSDFDIFFSWGMNRSHANGNFVRMPINDTISIPLGLLSVDGTEDQTGWAVFTGIRYTTPFSSLNNPKIGFEYNHGSKYWFSFTQGSTEVYNKLATRGDVFDFYYIQPLNKYLFFRTGYTYVDYEYTGSGWHIGQPVETDQNMKNIYFLLECRF